MTTTRPAISPRVISRRSPANCSAATRKKRGFNLIESAIVLGVVGLVIGGIWVAAAAVREKLAISRDLSLIITAVEKLRTLSQGQDGATWHRTHLANAGVFPADLLSGSTLSTHIGMEVVDVKTNINYPYSGAYGPIFMQFNYIPTKSLCIQLVTRLSALPNVSFIDVYNGSWADVEFRNIPASPTHITPITPDQVSAVIGSTSGCKEIDIVFF